MFLSNSFPFSFCLRCFTVTSDCTVSVFCLSMRGHIAWCCSVTFHISREHHMKIDAALFTCPLLGSNNFQDKELMCYLWPLNQRGRAVCHWIWIRFSFCFDTKSLWNNLSFQSLRQSFKCILWILQDSPNNSLMRQQRGYLEWRRGSRTSIFICSYVNCWTCAKNKEKI